MNNVLLCNFCGEKIHSEVWLLEDIKDFTNRTLYFGVCPKCHSPIVNLSEKRISDGKVFVNSDIHGKYAMKTLCREKKRLIAKQFELSYDNLSGFIYGVNKEIKYKKTVKIRQYSYDLKSNKGTKCKEIRICVG